MVFMFSVPYNRLFSLDANFPNFINGLTTQEILFWTVT